MKKRLLNFIQNKHTYGAMQAPVARYEWGLVVGVLLMYYYILASRIPIGLYIPYITQGLLIVCFAFYIQGFIARHGKLRNLYQIGHLSRLKYFAIMLAGLFIYGLANGNGVRTVLLESIFFGVFMSFLLVGGSDRTWYLIDRPITVMVYIGFFIMLAYRDVVALPDMEGFSNLDINLRFTNTVAYELRTLTAPAYFLFIWGAVNNRNRRWKILQIGSIAPLLLTDVGMFKFRSSLAFSLLICIIVFVVYPLLAKRRFKFSNYFLVGCIVTAAFSYLLQSDYWTGFTERAHATNALESNIFASRQAELETFFDQMGMDVIWGRGLGGYFDARAVFSHPGAKKWGILHFGIFGFMLRGGILFMLLFIFFFVQLFVKKTKEWYKNPCNLTAILFVPVVAVQISLSPFMTSLAWLPRYMITALILSRLGTIKQFPRRSFKSRIVTSRKLQCNAKSKRIGR